MIQFVCDNCSAVQDPVDAWIVGLAVESLGVVSARREINIQSSWTRLTAVHPFAVHFCSVECKDQYMARLFAPETTVAENVVERETPTEGGVEKVPARDRTSHKSRRKSRRKVA